MIAAYTVWAHGIMATLTLASLIYLFFKKPSANLRAIRLYFNWFLFFFLYNLFLILPLVIFDRLNLITGIFFNTALLFLAIGAWYAFQVGLNLMAVRATLFKLFSTIYLFGVLFATVLYFIFPEVPRVTSDGKWILWYSNQPVSLFYSLLLAPAGWLFVVAIFKGWTSLKSRLLKTRACFFGFSGFILPFAAFYYFCSKSATDIYLSFSLIFLALVSFLIGNVVLGFFIKHKIT